MKRFAIAVCWVLGSVWAAFSFIASNSPAEVETRAEAWLALPVIGQIMEYATSRVLFAITMLVLGVAVGMQVMKYWLSRGGLPWWHSLATDMSLLADDIEQLQISDKILADIEVMRVKVKGRNLAFPNADDRPTNVARYLPYLTAVSAHLAAGQLSEAKIAAQVLAQST